MPRLPRLLPLVPVLLSGMFCSGQGLQLKTQNIPVFTVVGLHTRTTTAQELSGHGSIAALWQQMMDAKLVRTIPNRASDDLIAVYTDFANGKDGEYTYLLGAKVTTVGKLPAGMISHGAGGGSYAVLTSEGELLGDMIIGSWRQIWAKERAGKLEHVYGNDFEVHYPGPADDPKHVAMDLFVRVK